MVRQRQHASLELPFWSVKLLFNQLRASFDFWNVFLKDHLEVALEGINIIMQLLLKTSVNRDNFLKQLLLFKEVDIFGEGISLKQTLISLQ